MIKLDCKDNFLNNSFTNLLSQKKLIPSIDNLNYFSVIQIKVFSESLKLIINNKNIEFKLPINVNVLLKEVHEKLFNINVDFANCNYFPYQRVIKSKDQKKIFLSYLQNIILSNLVVNSNGIEKYTLYKSIWPEDRNISINKLDTHLTNLKSHINSNLDIKINFQSQNKILKLIIN